MKGLITLMLTSLCAMAVCWAADLAGPNQATPGRAKQEEVTLDNAFALREQIIQQAMTVLKNISTAKPEFTEAERGAISVLGAYRSAGACKELLRVVSMTESQEGVSLIQSFPKIPFPLDRLPAAQALRDIGLPAVEAIIVDLQGPKPETVKDDLLRLYADILIAVLGTNHARAYVQEEATHVLDRHKIVFERLLKIPVMKQTSEWRRIEPEEWERRLQEGKRLQPK